MMRRTPKATRTATIFPYTPLCRSCGGPAAAERSRKGLGLSVLFEGEGIDLEPLPDGDLGDDMRGRAEADEADAVAVDGKAQRTPSDGNRAKQRSRCNSGEANGKREEGRHERKGGATEGKSRGVAELEKK